MYVHCTFIQLEDEDETDVENETVCESAQYHALLDLVEDLKSKLIGQFSGIFMNCVLLEEEGGGADILDNCHKILISA